MKFVFQILVTLLAAIDILLAWPAFYRLRQPTTLALWGIKVFISAITPLLFLTGVLTAIAGLALNWTPAIALGSTGALLFLMHIIAVTRAPDSSTDFEQAFGPDWEKRLPEESKAGFLPSRYVFRLPNVPDPVFEQNIVFHTIPHTNRQLLCDVWQPPKQVKRSGLTFIYLHGKHDILALIKAIRQLHERLTQAGIPVVMHLIPLTDHAFDLILPKTSPSAHNAYYDVERFLALMA